jgi:hypothetical protein
MTSPGTPIRGQDPSLGWIIDTGDLPVYDQRGQSGQGWYYWHMFGTDDSDAIQGPTSGTDGYINGIDGNDYLLKNHGIPCQELAA